MTYYHVPDIQFHLAFHHECGMDAMDDKSQPGDDRISVTTGDGRPHGGRKISNDLYEVISTIINVVNAMENRRSQTPDTDGWWHLPRQ